MLNIDKKIRQLYEINDKQVEDISQYAIEEDITIDSLQSRDDIDIIQKAFLEVIGYDITVLVNLVRNKDVDIDHMLDIKEQIAISDPDYNIDDIVSSFSSIENGTAAQDLENMFKDDDDDNNESLIYFKIPSYVKDTEEVISSKTVLNILDVDVYNEIRVNSLSFIYSNTHPNEEIKVPLNDNNFYSFIRQFENMKNGIISFLLPSTEGGVKIVNSVFSVEDGELLYFEKSEVDFIINYPHSVARQFSIFILGVVDTSMACGMWNWDGNEFSGVKKEDLIEFNQSIGLDKIFYQNINVNTLNFKDTLDIPMN
mgnify:FL=1